MTFYKTTISNDSLQKTPSPVPLLVALMAATLALLAPLCLAPARAPPGVATRAHAAMALPRRDALRLAGAAAVGAAAAPQCVSASFEGARWPLWPALPLAPYAHRKTIRREVGPGVWAFEQVQLTGHARARANAIGRRAR
eukprot:scaffold137823_cov28-Tisochrysis_lutea.AAC.5